MSKLCFVCQTQLTKPFFSVRSVIPVDSLRLLIFPYDCNLYPNNVCQKCKRRIEKEVIKFKVFIKKKQKEGSIMTGESYIEHIGGIENLSVRSADFLPHTEGPSCFVCKSLFLNIENDGDDDFQTPLGSPVANSSPHIPMDVDNFSIITSTPVKQRSAGSCSFNIFRGKVVKYAFEYQTKFSSTATVEVNSEAFWERLGKVDVSWLVDAETGWRKPEDNEMRYSCQFAIEQILTKSIVFILSIVRN